MTYQLHGSSKFDIMEQVMINRLGSDYAKGRFIAITLLPRFDSNMAIVKIIHYIVLCLISQWYIM